MAPGSTPGRAEDGTAPAAVRCRPFLHPKLSGVETDEARFAHLSGGCSAMMDEPLGERLLSEPEQVVPVQASK